MPDLKSTVIQIAIKKIWNHLDDHYFRDKDSFPSTRGERHDYWKNHLPLTRFETVDNYIQGMAETEFEAGFETADHIFSQVKTKLDL